jgi:hypothetical protein
MPHRLSRDFYRQVQHLLSRKHKPIVVVQPSLIDGAGKGVFAVDDIVAERAVCLYPGVYTPGLPLYAGLSEDSVYLAKNVTPSGVLPEHNPYLLNLHTASGGYLDGNALLAMSDEGTMDRRLDENPSACGHLVNHSHRQANVVVTAFTWRDVLEAVMPPPSTETDIQQYHLPPNALRADGSPWYLESSTVVRFPKQKACDEMVTLCGAALCTRTGIEKGAELLLDYNLKGPVLPAWAATWYSNSM